MKKSFTLTFLLLSITAISFGQLTNLRNSNQNKSYGANTNMEIFSNFILKQKLDSVVFEDYALFYSYDEQGHLIENIEKDWDYDNNVWNESFKFIYEYDNNLLSEETDFSKEDEQDWEKSSKTEYTYNQNLLELEVALRWDENSGEWINSSKIEYFYQDGQLDYEVYYFWIKSESIWAPMDKTEYFYDDDNNLISTILFSKSNDEWVNKFKSEFDRTDSVYVELFFDYKNDQWTKSSQKVAPIDEFGNLAEIVFYDWNNDIMDWEPSYKLSLTYDNNYALSDLLLPFRIEEDFLLFNHKLDILVENEWEDDSWIATSEGNLHYSGLDISATNNSFDDQAVVYPNPANNFIIFKTANEQNAILDIYNNNGQKLSSTSIHSNQIVNIKSLQNGFYFYHLKNEKQVIKGSFVKLFK